MERLPYRDILSAAARGHHAMDSVPTGITLTWLIMAAAGMSPLVVFVVVEVIGRVMWRKGPERPPRKLPDPG